jgi:hypothetical protein
MIFKCAIPTPGDIYEEQSDPFKSLVYDLSYIRGGNGDQRHQ